MEPPRLRHIDELRLFVEFQERAEENVAARKLKAIFAGRLGQGRRQGEIDGIDPLHAKVERST